MCVSYMRLLLRISVNSRHFLSTTEQTEAFFRNIEVQIFFQAIMFFCALYKKHNQTNKRFAIVIGIYFLTGLFLILPVKQLV